MRPILDTHALLWLALDSKRLSPDAKKAIRRASKRGGLGLASISVWEIAQLASLGRLRVQGTVPDFITALLTETGVGVVPLSPTIADLSTSFGSEFPRDPADRIIAATARAAAEPLITADERIRQSPLVTTIW